MNTSAIKRRPVPAVDPAQWPEVPEIIQRIYAARGVLSLSELDHRLSKLLPPSLLGDIDNAAALLAQAIMQDQTIMIAGDFDCDGATGSAVAYRGLRMLGSKHLHFTIPNRARHGYGLSPGLVEDMVPVPNLIVTVDSGVASVDGVAVAKDKGITVVITDHHLPGDVLPAADAIVNPNLKNDGFPSKSLAGVGVMFYTLLATLRHLRTIHWFNDERPEPNLTSLLDLVAVGTVADLVVLDANNRLIVEAGLRRIRAGRCSPGLLSLIAIGGRDYRQLVSSDIAFSIAPRINAAGRLEDMRIGVQCLITDDPVMATYYANQLEEINNARKERQQEMISEAERALGLSGPTEGADGAPETGSVATGAQSTTSGVVLFDPSWHAGIVGLVSSKLKDALHRPVIALAPASPGSTELRGSARSIPGFHLRDALAIVDTRNPGLMKKFGGHAMAAGLSLSLENVERFRVEFDRVASELITDDMLESSVYSDGELSPDELSVDFAKYLGTWGPWGQGFPQPCFDGVFQVVEHAIRKDVHLQLTLVDLRSGVYIKAMHFGGYKGQAIPERVRIAYELGVNLWKERESLQLMIRHLEPVGSLV